MRVTWPVVTSVQTTIGDGGNRPCCESLLSLKCVKSAAISLPLTKRQPPRGEGGKRGRGEEENGIFPSSPLPLFPPSPLRNGAIAPRRSASGSVDSTKSAF